MMKNRFLIRSAFFLLLLVSYVQPARGQFIDIILDVDSRVASQAVQKLSFGSFQPNSGEKHIKFGNLNMGIYSIRSLESQILLISLKEPVALHHQNPAIDEVIPLQLSAKFGYSAQNFKKSFPLLPSFNSITIKKDNSAGPWNKLYIFLFGTLEIRNIPEGIYTNDLILNIEYL